MNLLLGFATMIVCLIVQSLLIVFVARYHIRYAKRLDQSRFATTLLVISGVMSMLVVGNLVQAGIWASLFVWLGEFADFHEAFYHSAVNFATLGYGDIVMSDEHKMLGPLEAINGVLMIGASTAILMASIQDVVVRRSSGNDPKS
ncbi:MAG TPA: ion channel [Pseudomonadales bacterium]